MVEWSWKKRIVIINLHPIIICPTAFTSSKVQSLSLHAVNKLYNKPTFGHLSNVVENEILMKHPSFYFSAQSIRCECSLRYNIVWQIAVSRKLRCRLHSTELQWKYKTAWLGPLLFILKIKREFSMSQQQYNHLLHVSHIQILLWLSLQLVSPIGYLINAK